MFGMEVESTGFLVTWFQSHRLICVCLRAGYAAPIGAISSFSRGFWLTVFGFMYSSMVLDSCVKVRCLVLCIGKCLGRRCRSVIDIAASFDLLHICSLEETLSFCLTLSIIPPKNYFVLWETLNLLMTYFPGSDCSGNCIELYVELFTA
jgi:hypothetical protein